jgi:hypothetical protein
MDLGHLWLRRGWLLCGEAAIGVVAAAVTCFERFS